MGKDIQTEYGSIIISRDVIANLAGMATMGCVGVVGVVAARLTDGISELLRGESLAKGVEVIVDRENRLLIRVNVVVGYGNRINVIATNIMENVKYNVEKLTGLTVDHVEVNVQGVRIID